MSAPGGCTSTGSTTTCDFSSWSPPLYDDQFSNPINDLTINTIDGVIPSGALSGLACPSCSVSTPTLSLDCGFGSYNTMTLLSDSLSSNLTWVENLMITDCYNMQWQSGALSVLTSVAIMTVIAGNFTSISSSAFSGMTSLHTMYLYAGFPTSGVPSGLFDGLTSLTSLDMSRTALYSLPSGLFDDLTNLQSLQLVDTSLTTLPSYLFYPLISLTSLDLSENSWVCDCDLRWLGTYLFQTSFTMSNATCTSPAGLQNVNLTTGLLSLTSCTTTTTSSNDDDNDMYFRYGTIAGASLALLLAVMAIFCFIYLMNRQNELERTVRHLQDKGLSRPKHKSAPVAVTDLDGGDKSGNEYNSIEEGHRQEGNRSAGSRRRLRQVTPTDISVTKRSVWDPYKGWANF